MSRKYTLPHSADHTPSMNGNELDDENDVCERFLLAKASSKEGSAQKAETCTTHAESARLQAVFGFLA